jgi:hypothetical protein
LSLNKIKEMLEIKVIKLSRGIKVDWENSLNINFVLILGFEFFLVSFEER